MRVGKVHGRSGKGIAYSLQLQAHYADTGIETVVVEAELKQIASKTLTGRDFSIAKTEETKFHVVSFYLGFNCIDILVLKQSNCLLPECFLRIRGGIFSLE